MTFLALLLLTVSAGPPWYVRPATVAEDLTLLRSQPVSARPGEAFWLGRLHVYTEMGELLEVSPLVDELLVAFPGRPEFQEARMMILSLGGKHAEAVILGERLLREHPEYQTIRTNLARVYLKARRRADGVNMMLLALEQGPVRTEDWDLLLRALGVGTEDPEVVLGRIERKAEASPQLRSLKYVLVVLSTRFGRYEKARRILAENPELSGHEDLRRFLGGLRQAESPRPPARP